MLELKVFQTDSAKTIVSRYSFYANHPDRPRKGNKPRAFFQALSALTGAGKTPVLAQSVASLRAHFSSEPIVFWMSKAKSVVAQTYTNFSGGGKYSQIIDGFRVITVPQLSPELISDSSSPLLIMATTGLFNNKDQSEGNLNIYKKDQDKFGDLSPWERLIQRHDGSKRRPLLIVYDEGHNLSEQQTDILAELEPDAYLLASATMKLPANFNKTILNPIRLWVEETSGEEAHFKTVGALGEDGAPDFEKFITTTVDSAKVVDAQLVKKAIQFDGTTAAMESCLDDLHARLNVLESEINSRSLGFKPKAIYVCKTNIADDGTKDDHSKPFQLRKAPPIRIWRYLVETKGIDPKSIAIYANLDFVDGNKPDEVNLFSKGENDFDEFQAGDYQHIIFNQSLQEGWDDPACYLAYVDKSMGSPVQVEQVIGRVLRQFKTTHYDNPLLNSAHFFIRVDKQSVFSDAIQSVKAKLQKDGAPIDIIENFGEGGGGAEILEPKDDAKVHLCHVNVNAESACERINEIVATFPTFQEGSTDTIGQAHATSQTVDLTNLGEDDGAPDWVQIGHTNPVRLRWLVNTALKARSNRALAVSDFNSPKFDVGVQIQSNANKAAEHLADSIVDAYYQHSDLVYESHSPFKFGALRVPKKAPAFKNGLYAKYWGFNKFELAFAQELDKDGHTWHRNPSSGGFHIPLLSAGDTASFYPDFIVWTEKMTFCLDTKGSHLLTDAVARKLFDIQEDHKTQLQTRFITEGKQTALQGKALAGGFTVWKMRAGSPAAIHVDTLAKAVKECLK